MNHVYREIEGYTDDSLCVLYQLIISRMQNDGTAVEVGSYLGQSASFFIVEMLNQDKQITLYTIDTFEGTKPWLGIGEQVSEHQHTINKYGKNFFHAFKANLNRYNLYSYVTPIQEESIKASTFLADNSIDFIFIDGDHSYEAVMGDITAWYPKLTEHGVIAGHDYNPRAEWSKKGVIKAVENYFKDNYKVIGKCWLHQKNSLIRQNGIKKIF